MVCLTKAPNIIHFIFLVIVVGNFSGAKNHEIVIAKGNIIELLRPDETGKIVSISESPMFAVIRSILAFRLAGDDDSRPTILICISFSLFYAKVQIRTILLSVLTRGKLQLLNSMLRRMIGSLFTAKCSGKRVAVELFQGSIWRQIPRVGHF